MVILLTFLVFCLIIWMIILQDKVSTLQKDMKKTKKIVKLNLEEGSLQKPQNLKLTSSYEENLQQPVQQSETLKPEDTHESDINFEKVFLENIFNKIGAIALLIALGIFIKIIAPYFIFTPVIKILLGTLFAALALFTGLILNKKDKLKPYSEVVIGIGQAALFITLYCAASLYNLISIPVATTLALIFTASGFYLADRLKTSSSMWLILLAGYINPYFINKSITLEYLLGYFAILNLMSLVFVHRNLDKYYINIVNLILTSITIISFTQQFLSLKNLSKMFFLGTVIVYALLTLYYKRNNSAGFKPYVHTALIALTICTLYSTDGITRTALFAIEGLGLTFLAAKYLSELKVWSQIFFSAAAILTLCIDGATIPKDLVNYQPIYNIRTLAFAVVIIPAVLACELFKTDEQTYNRMKQFYIAMIYLYAAFEMNAILSLFALNHQVKFNLHTTILPCIGFIYALNTQKLYNITKYKPFKIGSYIISTIALLITIFNFQHNLMPFLNIQTIAYALAITTALYYAKESNVKKLFQYIAILLGFLCVHKNAGFVQNFWHIEYIVSIFWVLYAGTITIFGIFKKHKILTYAGIVLCLLTTARIFTLDLAELSSICKTIALLSLGVVLMIVSYLYTKYSKK